MRCKETVPSSCMYQFHQSLGRVCWLLVDARYEIDSERIVTTQCFIYLAKQIDILSGNFAMFSAISFGLKNGRVNLKNENNQGSWVVGVFVNFLNYWIALNCFFWASRLVVRCLNASQIDGKYHNKKTGTLWSLWHPAARNKPNLCVS